MMRLVLMYSTHHPSGGHQKRLEAMHPSAEVVVARDEAHAIDACQTASIILGHRYLSQSLPTARELAFVQSTSAGFDRLPLSEMHEKGVRLCRCTIASPTIARHAVTCAWAITRQLPEAQNRQQAAVWDASFDWPRQPRTALIVGAGSIGQAIARLLSKDGIDVIGVRGSGAHLPGDDFLRMHGPDALPELLPEADWCFLSLPLTDQSRGQFDHAMLSRLPKHSVLVNVARGEVIDTDALCSLMRKGHLAGAALDVLAPEAKAPDHPVWTTPRLILTPHIASHCAERPEQIEAFAEQQVHAFLNAQPLKDEVDLATQVSR